MPLEEPVFKFQREFETGKVILQPICRFIVGATNHVARVYFSPDGIKMMIPRSAIKDGSVVIWDDSEDEIHFSSAVRPKGET